MGIRNLSLSTAIEFNVDPIEDITDLLPVNKLYTWKQKCGERDPADLTCIVVHHTAVLKSVGATAAIHAKNHIEGKSIHETGEPGLPYHLYIKEGRIYQTNDLVDFVYGVANHNPYTVHICTEGNFLYDAFTETDRNALYAAIMAVKAVLPIDTIKGHNELQAKACPAIDMNRVRSDIKNIEMRIERSKTQEARLARGYDVANQASYMYNLSRGDDGDAAWAQHWLDEVHAIMKSKNLL